MTVVSKALVSIPKEFTYRSDYKLHSAIPHHNMIAVDEDIKNGKILDHDHTLYSVNPPDTKMDYKNQFHWRVNAAMSHIQSILINDFGFVKEDFDYPCFPPNKVSFTL